jgi:steroid delta-isomerase-like uncharacterized protein
MSAENEAVVRRWFEEGLNKGNLAALDELILADYVNHDPFPGQPPGREGVKAFFRKVRAGLPDVELVFEEMMSRDDRVMFRATLRGTHRGVLWGIPATGRTVAVGIMEVCRLAEGKVVERWGEFDMVGLFQQLGLLPPLELAETGLGRASLWLVVRRAQLAGGLVVAALAGLALFGWRRRQSRARRAGPAWRRP